MTQMTEFDVVLKSVLKQLWFSTLLFVMSVYVHGHACVCTYVCIYVCVPVLK